MAAQSFPDCLCLSKRLISSWEFPRRSAPGMPPCRGDVLHHMLSIPEILCVGADIHRTSSPCPVRELSN